MLSGSIAVGSGLLAPGGQRAVYAAFGFIGNITPTGQAVTIYPQVRTGNAGTSADWTTEPAYSGGIAVAAGATQPLIWRPSGSDFRLKIDAGATGPTTLTVEGALIPRSELLDA